MAMMEALLLILLLATTKQGNCAPQQSDDSTFNSGNGRDCGSFSAVFHIPSLTDKITDNSHLGSQLYENGGAAALHNSDTDVRSWTHKCGASLIGQRYLLTAAHCLNSSERLVSISLGRPNLDENANPESENIYKIQEFFIHPDYDKTRDRYNDIALLKTNRPVQYGPQIWPYCLPDSNEMYNDYLPAVIAGWGHVNQSHKASVIKSAFVKIIKNSRCASIWRTHARDQYDHLITYSYPNGLSSQILCAGRAGVDACEGDSGGPMSYQMTNGVNTVIGIVARGISNCPEQPIIPGLYTNVAHYIDWIYSTTGLPRPLPHPTKINEHDPELCAVFDSSTDCLKPLVSNQCKQLCALEDDPELCTLFDSSTDCLKPIVSNQCKQLCANAPAAADAPPSVLPSSCGRRQLQEEGNHRRTTRVVGGANADWWPWMVLLMGRPAYGGTLTHFCFGTLITDQFVITAAHCKSEDIILESVKVGELIISTNPDSYKGRVAPPVQDIPVAEFIIHPQHQDGCRPCNNIALIRLPRPVIQVEGFVSPICLPLQSEQKMDFSVSQLEEKVATTAGWGSTSSYPFDVSIPDHLQEVDLTIKTSQFCSKQTRDHPTGSVLCAGSGDGKDTCMGDSGAPLMITNNFGTRHFLVGITSFGSRKCGSSGTQTIFTSVEHYLPWIQQIIGNNSSTTAAIIPLINERG